MEKRNPYNILVGMSEGKRPHGRPRHRREDNIKMNLQEIGRKGWTGCIQLRKGTSCGLL
jgi:hypothetical protein